jgi:hypothetical protein
MALTTIEEAQYEVEVAVQEAQADNPEVGADDIAHDMVISIAYNCTPEVARELCRREFGWVPQELEAWLGRKDWIDS